jgi:GntR family transcriptional regulator, carbon starvation induced regulator
MQLSFVAMDLSISTPRSLTSQAFERLRHDILQGHLAPSERLRIQALSERYQIGATAIREALSRLVTDGLVESEDQRGFTVTPVSHEELLDLTRTRIQIEQMALRMAVEKGDLEWETQVLSCFHRLSRLESQPWSEELLAAWAVAHRQFHEALIMGCGSLWTLRLCRLLYDKSERYRNLSAVEGKERGRDVTKEHKELADAAMARDADALCHAIEAHFGLTTKLIVDGDAAPRAVKRKKVAG